MTLKEEYVHFLGPGHFVYLIGFAIALYFLMSRRDVVRRNADKADRILAVVVIFQQILLYATYVFHYHFDLAESLPFHICRITSLFILAYLFTKKRTFYVIGTAFGLFALFSFAYPADVVPINHPIGLSFFISHTVNLLFGLYGKITRGFTIGHKDIVLAIAAFILYFFFAYFFNPLVDGNYFYFKEKPLVGDMPDLLYVPLSLSISLLLIVLGMRFYTYLDQHFFIEGEKYQTS